MTVYVLFHETNVGHSEQSDGYVEGIYQRLEDAEAARLAAIRAARDAGYVIWWDPDLPAEEQQDRDWEHDWVVYPYQVLETAELPREGFFDFLWRFATPNGPRGMEEG